MNNFTIGTVAKSAGVGIETIRFYEREGLIQPLTRTEANYRLYSEEGIIRLRFIKRAKALGFSLKEIKGLLSLRVDPQASKAEVKAKVTTKITDIKSKIKDLKRIQKALEALDDCCDGHGLAVDCPILLALDGDDELPVKQYTAKQIH